MFNLNKPIVLAFNKVADEEEKRSLADEEAETRMSLIHYCFI